MVHVSGDAPLPLAPGARSVDAVAVEVPTGVAAWADGSQEPFFGLDRSAEPVRFTKPAEPDGYERDTARTVDRVRALAAVAREMGLTEVTDGELRIVLGPLPQRIAAAVTSPAEAAKAFVRSKDRSVMGQLREDMAKAQDLQYAASGLAPGGSGA